MAEVTTADVIDGYNATVHQLVAALVQVNVELIAAKREDAADEGSDPPSRPRS